MKLKLMVIAVSVLTTLPATAKKPSWAGGGKSEQSHHSERHHDSSDRYENKREHHGKQANFSDGNYFNERHKLVIRDYYENHFRTGHCPPGLAKKNNGCVPPGQEKHWHLGQKLPGNVTFYDLPQSVLSGIEPPPSGYRFVRVASDILMISIGTGMVVDAINDLGRHY